MNKPHVLGKNVYIDIPEKPEYKIEVDANTKEELEREWISKFNKLQVWAVGEAANPSITEGCWVLVDPEAIRNLKMIPFGDETKGLILDYHIVHIWP